MIYIDLANNKQDIELQHTFKFRNNEYNLQTFTVFLDSISKEDITQQFLDELLPLLCDYLNNNGYLEFVEKIDSINIIDKYVKILSLVSICTYDLNFMAKRLLKHLYFDIPNTDIYEISSLQINLGNIQKAQEDIANYELTIKKISDILVEDIKLENRQLSISNTLEYTESYIKHKLKYLEDKTRESIAIFQDFKNKLDSLQEFHSMKLNEFNKSQIINIIPTEMIVYKMKYIEKGKIAACTFNTLILIDINANKVIKQANTYATLLTSIDARYDLIAVTDLDCNLMLWDINLNMIGKYKMDDVAVGVNILKKNVFAITMNTGQTHIFNIKPSKNIFQHDSELPLVSIILTPQMSIRVAGGKKYFSQVGIVNENKTIYYIAELFNEKRAIALSNGSLYLQKNMFKFIEKAHAFTIVGLKVIENNVYTASADGIIKIWNLDSFDCINTINIDSNICCIDVKYNHIVISTIEKKIIVINNSQS